MGWNTPPGILVRRNGLDIGTRRRINLIQGTGISLTVADDSGNGEVDVTIAATGGGGGGSTVPEWMERLATPLTPHTDDQEFTGTIGGTAFTPLGTVNWLQDAGLLTAKFFGQASGDQAGRAYALTPTTPPVTIITRLQLLSQRVSNPMAGLMFLDGDTVTANATSIAIYYTGGGMIVARFAGTPNSMSTTNINTGVPYTLGNTWAWLALIWTATNTFTYALSMDGINWTDFAFTTWTATLTPTHFAPMVTSWSRTEEITASFETIRVSETDESV